MDSVCVYVNDVRESVCECRWVCLQGPLLRGNEGANAEGGRRESAR